MSNTTSTKRKAGRPLGTSKGSHRPLTDKEVSRLLKIAAAGSSRDAAMLSLMVGTGCRIGEAASLSIRDVAPDGEVIGSVVLDRNVTKNGKSRRLQLSERAHKVISAFVKEELSKGADLDRALFCGRSGGFLSKNYITQRVSGIFKDAGIHDASSHSLRATFATALATAGVQLHLIQRLLGHASLQTTQRYLGATQPQLADAVAVLKF